MAEQHATSPAAHPVAITTSGPVRGHSEDGVLAFKGVPYGAPTGGAARWLPPRPAATWTEPREAMTLGAMCPQVFGAPMPEETAVLQPGPMSEDCLNLNVWTPAVGDAPGRRPVMVWFHGGAFALGSAGSTTTDGSRLAGRNDVVVVAVNHRLNLFGFLDLSAAGPAYARSANVGMLDCVAALQWVRNNIAAFGGDPGNVTIFGQSGGGLKVMNLMAMPAAKDLFHRAIAQSGFALAANAPEQAAAVAKTVADTLGVAVDNLAALRALPAERLVGVLEARPDLVFALGPSVDGEVLPAGPFAPAAPALSAGVPMMLGTTETEIVFLPFAPVDPIDDAGLDAHLKQYTGLADDDLAELIAAYRAEYPDHDNTYLYQVLASDWLLGADAVVTAERKAAANGAPAFVYYFTKHTAAREGKLRSPHTLDVPFVFDNLDSGAPILGTPTAADQALADRLSRTWATFARTGNPNNEAIPAWPAYNTERRAVLVIGDDGIAVETDPRRQTRIVMARLKAKAAQSLAQLATGQ